MFFSKWLCKLFSQETLACRDRGTMRQLLRRPRHSNNYRPILEGLEPIIVMSSVVWTGASGDWSAAASWTDSSDGSHHVPGLTDDAVINTAVTVTHSTNSDSVLSLTLGAGSVVSNLTLSGGTLTVSGSVQNQGLGAFTLANGVLAGATIAAGTTLQVAPGANSSTLSGVTLNSALTVPGNTTLNVTNNLALGGATLIDSGTFNLSGGTQSVTGTGAISGSGTIKADTSSSTITFAGGVTLSGGLNVGLGSSTGVTWIFQGAVSAGIGQTLTLSASSDAFINQGAWRSISGSTLTLGGIWTNNGTITVSGATSSLNLGGNFATDAIGTLNHTSGAVNITGSLDNAGTILALDNTTGAWNIANGTISGGVITTAGSAMLSIVFGNNGVLSGVTWAGTLMVDHFSTLNITNGMALDGGLLSVSGTLRFSGATQSVTGAGAISGGGTILADTTGSTITFSSGVTLSGALNFGSFSAVPGVTWIFQGTVTAGTGQTMALSQTGDVFINEAAWRSINGGTLTLGGNWINRGAITLTGANSTLNLGGAFTTDDIGTLNYTSGTINIAGSLDNAGNTVTLNDTTGSWNVTSDGTITGGIITTAGRAMLNMSGGTLSGVTLNGAALAGGMSIRNGLALEGGILFYNASLHFLGGSQSVTGTGAFTGNGGIYADTAGSSITFASGVNFSGGLVVGGSAGVTWIFQGTVSAGVGQTVALSMNGDTFINEGAWRSTNGGTLTLGGNWTNNGIITVTGTTSTLNLSGNFTTAHIGTVNHTSGTVNITGSLNNAGNTLALNDTTGTWNLADNGTISGGIITTAGSAMLDTAGRSDATLSGVTLVGNMMVNNFSTLNISNGLTLNDAILGGTGALNFTGGSQSVTGTGAITGNRGIYADTAGRTITFASGVSLSGGPNVGGTAVVTWIFQGTVSAGAGQTVALFASDNTYINQGVWQSISGGTLTLGGNWTNNGTITVAGATSTLNLGGTFNAARMGTINNTNGIINIVGTLNNAGNTLALDNATGTWNLLNGTITGGTITTADSAVLNIPQYSDATFSGVTLNGTVTLGEDDRLNIVNGLTLNGGTLTDVDSNNASLNFRGGSQSVTGTGAIIGSRTIQADTNGSTITFASGVTLSGGLTIGGGSGTHTWIFQGAVSANLSGQTLAFSSGDTFTNQGTFEARNGGTLLLPTGPRYTNYSGTTLTGGAWQVFGGSKMILVGSGIATNAASILLDGSGSTIYRDAPATIDALNVLTSLSPGGSFTIENSRNFTTAGNFTNNATLSVKTGTTFTVNGSLINFDAGSGTLTGGAYNIAGTLRFNNADITTNAANVVLDGTGAAAIVDQTGADALANFAANAATGTFTIQNGLTFSLPGAFTNAGTFVIGTGNALAVNGTFTQTSGGATKLSSGAALTSFGGVTIAHGSSLSGAGTINADVLNAGEMSIGDSTTTGILTINGFFLQTASGTLTIKVGGFATAGADFDQLVVSSGHVDGTLNVTLINDYTPTTGDSIAVMTFDSLTGTFAELGGDGGLFTAAYDPMDVTLRAN
jgi:hypothetical protein